MTGDHVTAVGCGVRWLCLVALASCSPGEAAPVPAVTKLPRDLTSCRLALRTFELGGPDQVSWDELYDRIRRVLGKRRLQVRVPGALAAAGATAAQVVPKLKGAKGALAILEYEDNITDIGLAVAAFGIQPISLDDQLRRAVAA